MGPVARGQNGEQGGLEERAQAPYALWSHLWAPLGSLLTVPAIRPWTMSSGPPSGPGADAPSALQPSWFAVRSVLPDPRQPLPQPPSVSHEVPTWAFGSGQLEGREPLIHRPPVAPKLPAQGRVPQTLLFEGGSLTSPSSCGTLAGAGVTGTSNSCV